MSDHHRKLERMYHGAPINAFFRPKLTITEGASEVRCEARRELYHAAGSVHGSVYFKMLDDAAFFAVASTVTDVFVLTASFHVSLLRPITAGEMRAVGKVVRASPTLCVAEAILYDPAGREAARGMGDFVRSRVMLDPSLGYE